MVRLFCSVIVLFLAISAPLSAETDDINLPDLFKTQGLHLHRVNSELSLQYYEYTTYRNQHLFNKAVKSFLNTNLESLGTAGTVIKFTGEAAYLAVKSAKLDLNESKTLAIEVNNLVDSDREILYTINISW